MWKTNLLFMKPASTIEELYNNLNPFFIPEQGRDENVYVPVFDEALRKLRTQILAGDYPKECFYITGQAGSGKSTALNFLKNDKLEDKFELIYIQGRQLLDLADVDVIDVLLMFALEVNERLKKKGELTEKLRKIDNKHRERAEIETTQQTLKGTGTEGSYDISLSARFFQFFGIGAEFRQRYRREKEYRIVTRSFFTFDKNELLKLVNDLIHQYYQDNGSSKKILAIFDDLEKIRNIDQMNSLFIENSYYFRDIECKKVLTYPIYLTTNPTFKEINRYFFGLKIYKNPLEPTDDHDTVERNRNFFSEIIRKRIQSEKILIQEDAISHAIEISGGNLKQYLDILYRAALFVLNLEGRNISLDDIRQATYDEKRNLEQAIIGDKLIRILYTIATKHLPVIEEETTEFIQAILSLQVIVFYNNSVWYDVNPLIRKTIEVYAAAAGNIT